MNERIKELMKQSGAYDYYEVNEGVDGDEQPMIKFAELIVIECAELCLKYAEYEGPFNTMGYRKGQHFNTIIKHHFGVEQ